MNLYRVFGFGLFVFVLVFICPNAYSNEFNCLFDLNTPVSSLEPRGLQSKPDLNSELGLRVGFFPKSLFGEGGSHRFGVVIGRKKVWNWANSSGRGPGPYSALRIQGQLDFRIWQKNSWEIRGGGALGFDYLNDSSECDSPFCGWPDPFVLVSPNIRASIQLSQRFVGIFDVRGDVYMTSQGVTFPFESGVVYSLGIGVIGSRKRTETKSGEF